MALTPEQESKQATQAQSSISVVIPCHNYARFIEECLRSVFAQSLPPYQLLVIDDGSVDGSPTVIERVLSDCPFPAELIARSQRGVSATLNEGLEKTRGDFFAYLNADDIWHPERLEVAVEALTQNPDVVMSYGECLFIDGHGRYLASTEDNNYHIPDLTLHQLLKFQSVPMVATVTYRRSFLEQVAWNESTIMEDYENYLVMRSMGPFLFVPRALGYWRLHGSNFSSARNLSRNMREVQETQRRVAARLGIDERQLARYQSSVRFVYGEHFLRAGQWKQGAALTVRNLRAAPSASALRDRVIRMLVPPSVISARRALLNIHNKQRMARELM